MNAVNRAHYAINSRYLLMILPPYLTGVLLSPARWKSMSVFVGQVSTLRWRGGTWARTRRSVRFLRFLSHLSHFTTFRALEAHYVLVLRHNLIRDSLNRIKSHFSRDQDQFKSIFRDSWKDSTRICLVFGNFFEVLLKFHEIFWGFVGILLKDL